MNIKTLTLLVFNMILIQIWIKKIIFTQFLILIIIIIIIIKWYLYEKLWFINFHFHFYNILYLPTLYDYNYKEITIKYVYIKTLLITIVSTM